MKQAIIKRLHKNFEDYVHIQEGVEFWFARDLQKLLGYTQWRNLLNVIEKAKESCKNSDHEISDHFADVSKMVVIGSNTERSIEDIKLTRYACYLIAQNGDPRKEEIAFAQSYFAVQTRKQEIIEDHIRLSERLKARKHLKDSEKELSRNIYERGVDESGFARIRSKGGERIDRHIREGRLEKTSVFDYPRATPSRARRRENHNGELFSKDRYLRWLPPHGGGTAAGRLPGDCPAGSW